MAIRVTPKNQAPLSEITFIVLDLETTGASPANGCAITEIGAIAVRGGEILEEFSTFVNPQVALPEYIINLTGITDEMLVGAPLIDQAFPDFIEFINRHKDVHLVAHNAPFDIGFLDAELSRLGMRTFREWTASVVDTLALARQMHPGRRNSLDALCERYGIANSHRTLHGALLDAQLLADVYLAMTRGQDSLEIAPVSPSAERGVQDSAADDWPPALLRVVVATDEELVEHDEILAAIARESKKPALWTGLAQGDATTQVA